MKFSKISSTARWVRRECANVFHTLNPASRRKAAKWEAENGPDCLRRIGIKSGDFVLDFGCGPGRFSISAAQLVGAMGQVYAIDSNPSVLWKVRRKADALGLQNIRTAGSLAELARLPGARRYDVALAFDMLHFLDPPARNRFYRELRDILSDNGLLAVHPKHVKTDEPAKFFATMTAEDVAREIEAAGYRLDQRLPLLIWHAHDMIGGTVWRLSKNHDK